MADIIIVVSIMSVSRVVLFLVLNILSDSLVSSGRTGKAAQTLEVQFWEHYAPVAIPTRLSEYGSNSRRRNDICEAVTNKATVPGQGYEEGKFERIDVYSTVRPPTESIGIIVLVCPCGDEPLLYVRESMYSPFNYWVLQKNENDGKIYFSYEVVILNSF